MKQLISIQIYIRLLPVDICPGGLLVLPGFDHRFVNRFLDVGAGMHFLDLFVGSIRVNAVRQENIVDPVYRIGPGKGPGEARMTEAFQGNQAAGRPVFARIGRAVETGATTISFKLHGGIQLHRR